MQQYFEEGEEGTEEEERREKEVMNTIKKTSSRPRNNRDIHQKGHEAQKEKEGEETYTIGDYTILDVNWGDNIQKNDQGRFSKGERKQGNRCKK